MQNETQDNLINSPKVENIDESFPTLPPKQRSDVCRVGGQWVKGNAKREKD
jgi:hypothetical protein